MPALHTYGTKGARKCKSVMTTAYTARATCVARAVVRSAPTGAWMEHMGRNLSVKIWRRRMTDEKCPQDCNPSEAQAKLITYRISEGGGYVKSIIRTAERGNTRQACMQISISAKNRQA